jgi:hypothetical protein
LVGQIEYAVRSSRMSKGAVLTANQWAQFRSMLDQAKLRLDSLRTR